MSFRFMCYKKLKTSLGEIDSIVEAIELSTREFIQNISQDGMKKENIQNNIENLSKKHNIKVNYIDINNFENRVIQLHIVNAAEQLEYYIKNLKLEHPIFRNCSNKQDNESDLDYILRILGLGILKQSIEYSILNHYRLIRNRFVHADNEDKNEYLKRIQTKINHTQYTKLSAPNIYEKLVFDDFILFTRAIKEFAKLLNQHAKPETNELANIIKEKYKSKLNKFSNNPTKKLRVINKLILFDYNFKCTVLAYEIMKD